MKNKDCIHLIRGEHNFKPDYLICDITKKVCIASEFNSGDYGHPASVEYYYYDENKAKLCPSFKEK